MSNKFARVPIATANRSKHDLSAPHITTTDFGRLDVVYHTQLVEGDDLNMNLHSFLRAAPMVFPTFGKVYLNVRAFFLPFRILCDKSSFDWNLWRNNLSNNAHPYTNESNFVIGYAGAAGGINPTIPANQRKDYRRILSQMGFPQRVFNQTIPWPSGSSYYNQRYNDFVMAAYQRVWWDWYRDSNLIDDSQFSNYVDLLRNGSNAFAHLGPRYVCYPKDFFTTLKVNPQEGNYNVVTNFTTPINRNIGPTNPKNLLDSTGDQIIDTIPNSSTTATIQYFRAANSLQKYLERNHILGGRVMARFYGRFGVAPDAVRLDQSEYCGGFTTPLNIGDVTANLGSSIDQSDTNNAFVLPGNETTAGSLSGKGYVDGGTSDINYYAKEDGIFIVTSSLAPEVFYYEGIPNDLLRGINNVKEDYFTPEYEGIGYEPVEKCQVAANRNDLDNGVTDHQVFGFAPRYSSYKFKLGTISGDHVLNETKTGMQSMHLARTFLNSGGTYGGDLLPAFTMITPEDRFSLDRIFQFPGNSAGDYDHFTGVHLASVQIVRPMSAAQLPCLEEDAHSAGKKVVVDNGGIRM